MPAIVVLISIPNSLCYARYSTATTPVVDSFVVSPPPAGVPVGGITVTANVCRGSRRHIAVTWMSVATRFAVIRDSAVDDRPRLRVLRFRKQNRGFSSCVGVHRLHLRITWPVVWRVFGTLRGVWDFSMRSRVQGFVFAMPSVMFRCRLFLVLLTCTGKR